MAVKSRSFGFFVINVCNHGEHYEMPCICQIVMKLEFSQQIFEKHSNFMKIHPDGDKLFHADGQTDVTKLIVSFVQLCEHT